MPELIIYLCPLESSPYPARMCSLLISNIWKVMYLFDHLKDLNSFSSNLIYKLAPDFIFFQLNLFKLLHNTFKIGLRCYLPASLLFLK